MKSNWQIKKLGNVCEVTTGNSNTVDAVRDGQYAFFDRSKIIKRSNRFLFDSEALIIPGEGAEFFPKYYSGKFDLHQRAYALLNFDKETDIKFVEYFLIFEHKYFERVAVGATAKSLRRRHFLDFEIPLPTIVEQRRIVNKLDEIFEHIVLAKENAEKNLKNSRELFESYLQSVFFNPKFEKKRLGEIAPHSLGKMLDKEKNRGEMKPYLRNFNVRWFGFDLSDVQEMKFQKEEAEKYTAIKGDVLICEGGYPGRAGIWMEDQPIYFQKAVHRVRFKSMDESKWFLYYLYLSHGTGELKKYLTGTGILHFTGTALDSFIVPTTVPSEQKAIVKKLDALSAETKKLEAIYKQKIADLEELKKSVLKKAFAGGL